MKRTGTLKKYGYFWVTMALFLVSLTLHWVLAWKSYTQEQAEHGQPVSVNDYLVETGRDTMENWQSEFLQLIWQVAGLSLLWFVGSPDSKEGDDRKEEKLDYIIRTLDPKEGENKLKSLEKKYPKK